MIPSMIKLAFDSPGCTHEEMMIADLSAISYSSDSKLVIISISQSFPASVLHIEVFLTRSLTEVVTTPPKNLFKSVYV
jgi:hypothetical protein